ncbi:MAG TPA: methyltransferase domain-containing protein [Verrucomicrobiota bacterium]|nr:methyltransferase domain-containing protein [Verrucomicrobiota bacterium]
MTDWESLYQAGDMRWEKGAPSPGLVDFLASHAQLPEQTVCVPGGGTGHDALEWAKAGFRVYGYDIAPSAVRLSAQRAAAAGVPVQFRQADFLRDEPPFPFDWIFEHTLFCAIQPVERDLYIRAVQRWLKPGGNYLAINYIITEDDDGPPFPCTREELVRRFSPHFDLIQDHVPRSYPNREGRERLFWWKRR